MAWPAPILPAAWPGTEWGKTSFWNAFLKAAGMRAKAAAQLGGGSDSYDEIDLGANIQSVGQINLMRPSSASAGAGLYTLRFHGAFTVNDNDVDAATAREHARTWVWADPAELAEGLAWDPADHVMWSPSTGFTQGFVNRVNDILGDWGLDPMGSTVLSGGQIPWTRKYGDRNTPTVARGEMQEGDIIGEWLFNEWRAVLEALDAMPQDPTWSTPDTWMVWQGNGEGEETCADAKDGVTATWEDARARAVSPVTDPPGRAGASGSISFDTGEGYSASFERTWLEFEVDNCGGVDHGTFRLYLHVRSDDTFEDFGDGHTLDVIAQIEETTTAPFTLSSAPFKDPSTADEDIQDVACPPGVDDSELVEESYYFDEVPGMVCVLAFPDP